MAERPRDGWYVETDFLLTLIKDDDWLGDKAKAIYGARQDELWTTRDTLLELLMLAYREQWDAVRVVANAKALLTQNQRGSPRLEPWEEASRWGITTVASGRPTPTLNTKMGPTRFGDGGQANSALQIRGERRAAG